MLTDYERDLAVKEGHRNKATADYFEPRSHLHNDVRLLNLFGAGFDRGWDAGRAPLLARIAELEAQVEQAAQPVAQWQKMHPLRTNGRWENTDEFDAKWWRDNSQGWEIRPLYTAPPKAVPLTQPEKQRLWNDAMYNNRSSTTDAAMEFGSAIESAHDIGAPATVEKEGE